MSEEKIVLENQNYSVAGKEDELELGRLKFYVYMILLGWTLAIILFFFLGHWGIIHSAYDKTRHTALNAFEKDVIYRQWVADHGGVYVPVTDKTPPNPYLTMVENRDLQTEIGPLTLVNPSYMTRQVFELQMMRGIKVRGHITSLRPIRPENKPDEWETGALQDFEKGIDEKVSIEKIDGERYMRFMKPFKVNASCLKCHAQQGYKLGDIRGGISVSIPMAFIDGIIVRDTIYLAVACGGIWLIGCGGIVFGGVRLNRTIVHRHELEEEVRRSEELYDMSQKAAHIGSWSWDIALDKVYWSSQISEIVGITPDELCGGKDAFLCMVVNEDRYIVDGKIKALLNKGSDYDAEYRILRKDGSIRWLSVIGKLLRDNDGMPYRMLGIMQDITERKLVEEEILRVRRREIGIGMEIQNQLLLGRPPQNIEGVHIAAISIPAQQIGGDFYDFVQYDRRHFDLFLGDVMGKGISAALCGAATKTQMLRVINDLICASHLATLPTLEEVIDFAHREMSPRLIAIESFATLCIARINIDTMKMGLIDCGHTSTIHYHSWNGICETIKSDNCPMGFDPDEVYKQQDVNFEPGDVFMFYSDGVIEAWNKNGELYGLDRLLEFVKAHGYMDAQELLHAIASELESFAGTTAFRDDVTYIVVKIS